MQVLSRKQEIALIERTIEGLGDDITILEAGCGRRWPLTLSVQYRLVGVDPDAEALRARVAAHGDLDEYQINTLNDARFPERSFDVIYCSYVLEHVVGVEEVLENFARWIKPGGLLVLRIPDDRSVYGFLARTTPHWVHVLAKKYIFGLRNAGRPGFGPYPVVYERAMSLEALRRYCARRGYSMSVTANGQYLERAAWLAPFAAAISLLSLGYLRWRHCDLAVIIEAAGHAGPARQPA